MLKYWKLSLWYQESDTSIITYIQHFLEILDRKKANKRKCVRIGNKSLLAHDMIMCPENPNESEGTLLMSEFRKVTRCKINMQYIYIYMYVCMYLYIAAIRKFKNITSPKR